MPNRASALPFDCDVVVVGAGPAGANAARFLAGRGRRVVLVERYRNFADNDFSSAGAPLSILSEHQLPEAVVASRWRGLELFSNHESHRWWSPQDLGVVLDFAGLRDFLTRSAQASGAEFRPYCDYLSHRQDRTGVEVELLDKGTGQALRLRTRYLLDATGVSRAVISRCPGYRAAPRYMMGVGLEYLVRVDAHAYFDDRLQMFLGTRWAPRGYGWAFPMRQGLLKIGVCRYLQTGVRENQSLKQLNDALTRFVARELPFEILNVHGGTVKYARGRRDRVRFGRVLATGDAVSTINPLGGEGIRYAMESGRWAAEALHAAMRESEREDMSGWRIVALGMGINVGLSGGGRPSRPLNRYPKLMRRKYNWRWKICEWLANFVYLRLDDAGLDRLVRALRRFESAEPLVDVLFHYRFVRVWRGVWRAARTEFMTRLRAF